MSEDVRDVHPRYHPTLADVQPPHGLMADGSSGNAHNPADGRQPSGNSPILKQAPRFVEYDVKAGSSVVPAPERELRRLPFDTGKFVEKLDKDYPSLRSGPAAGLFDAMLDEHCEFFSHGGDVYARELSVCKLFWKWWESPGLRIEAGIVAELSARALIEFLWHKEWNPVSFGSSWLPPLHSDQELADGSRGPSEWTCLDLATLQRRQQETAAGQSSLMPEGLYALSGLFLEQAKHDGWFQGRPGTSELSTNPDSRRPPWNPRRPCDYMAWEQWFYVGLLSLGIDPRSYIHPEQDFGLHALDYPFMLTWARRLQSSPKPKTRAYYRFACAWDKCPIPLRLWDKDAARLAFQQMTGQRENAKEWKRRFYDAKGSLTAKRAPGLIGLKPDPLAVATAWEGRKQARDGTWDPPRVTISKAGAKKHGMSLERCARFLEEGLEASAKVS